MVAVRWGDGENYYHGIAVGWVSHNDKTVAIVMSDNVFLEVSIDRLTFDGWRD